MGNKKNVFGIFFVLVFFISLISFSSAISVSVSVPDKYSEVEAGDQVYFETSIKWPENKIRKDLRLEYSIVDENDREVAYSKVLKAIETQASFVDFMTLPEGLEKGVYRIYVNVSDYKNLGEEAAASFHIKNNFNLTLLLIGVSVFVGVMLVFISIELLLISKRRS